MTFDEWIDRLQVLVKKYEEEPHEGTKDAVMDEDEWFENFSVWCESPH